MDLSYYKLGSFRDGQVIDREYLRSKSKNGKLIFIKEDATTYVYEDSELDNIVDLFAEGLGGVGSFIIFSIGCDEYNENDKCYKAITGDEVEEYTKSILAYDEDNDVIYGQSYIPLDDAEDVCRASEHIGMDAALKALVDEIDGDEDVVVIKVVKN